jgi:Spy/CpxP family protein refolding chaperone
MKRWPIVALGVSLALNVLLGAYLAGTFVQRDRRGPEAVAEKLDLRPEQREAFQRHTRVWREGSRKLREETRPLLQESWRELAKPTPDQAVLDRLTEESLDRRRAFQREAIASMRRFLETLDPEQRTRFLDLMRERGERRRGRDS